MDKVRLNARLQAGRGQMEVKREEKCRLMIELIVSTGQCSAAEAERISLRTPDMVWRVVRGGWYR